MFRKSNSNVMFITLEKVTMSEAEQKMQADSKVTLPRVPLPPGDSLMTMREGSG